MHLIKLKHELYSKILGPRLDVMKLKLKAITLRQVSCIALLSVCIVYLYANLRTRRAKHIQNKFLLSEVYLSNRLNAIKKAKETLECELLRLQGRQSDARAVFLEKERRLISVKGQEKAKPFTMLMDEALEAYEKGQLIQWTEDYNAKLDNIKTKEREKQEEYKVYSIGARGSEEREKLVMDLTKALLKSKELQDAYSALVEKYITDKPSNEVQQSGSSSIRRGFGPGHKPKPEAEIINCSFESDIINEINRFIETYIKEDQLKDEIAELSAEYNEVKGRNKKAVTRDI